MKQLVKSYLDADYPPFDTKLLGRSIPFDRKGQPVATFVWFNVLTIRSVNIDSNLDGRDCHGVLSEK